MPDIEAKLHFLRQPQSYGAAAPSATSASAVVCLETHMSWVFLVGERVYKLKKPVCLAFLDFRSLQDRAFYCREEVRLNARLAPGVYLGVVALQWDGGRFALVPEAQLGERTPYQTVDWLVQMRRLPVDAMLPWLMRSHQVQPASLDNLVTMLGRFYREAAAIPLTEDAYRSRFAAQQQANRAVLLRPGFGLHNAARAIAALDRLGSALAPQLGARASRGWVLEGHGDLRPDHVCLLPQPLVIDCLEFNAQLRQLDPFHELALLDLECGMAGSAWIGAHLLAGLHRELGEQPAPALQGFYLAHQALLRARLAAAHLLDPVPRTPHKWLPLAQAYIARALAEEALRGCAG